MQQSVPINEMVGASSGRIMKFHEKDFPGKKPDHLLSNGKRETTRNGKQGEYD